MWPVYVLPDRKRGHTCRPGWWSAACKETSCHSRHVLAVPAACGSGLALRDGCRRREYWFSRPRSRSEVCGSWSHFTIGWRSSLRSAAGTGDSAWSRKLDQGRHLGSRARSASCSRTISRSTRLVSARAAPPSVAFASAHQTRTSAHQSIPRSLWDCQPRASAGESRQGLRVVHPHGGVLCARADCRRRLNPIVHSGALRASSSAQSVEMPGGAFASVSARPWISSH